jgi:hypothetical protein
MFRRIGVLLLAVLIWCVCLELGEQFAIPGLPGFVSTAEAVVGRPLTPMSAAGVARRTSRRCAAGVYCSASAGFQRTNLSRENSTELQHTEFDPGTASGWRTGRRRR